jgi:hypothetical protein
VTILVERSMAETLFVLLKRVMLHLPAHVVLARFVRSKTKWIALLLVEHFWAMQQRVTQTLVQVLMVRVVRVNPVLLNQK